MPASKLPRWLMNDKLEMDAGTATGWLHVPLRVCHPWVLPEVIRQNHVVAFQQTGPLETIIHSGIRAGIFLTVGQLKLLQGSLKFPIPNKKEGSGKSGRLVKKDYAKSLVDYLFPGESEKNKSAMLLGIMGRTWKHLDPKQTSKHSAGILKAFNGLPQDDMQEFSKLAAVASDEILLNERRDQRARVESCKTTTKQYETPLELRDLHPAVMGCRITRHPVLKRFQAFYTTFNDKGGSLLVTLAINFCVST